MALNWFDKAISFVAPRLSVRRLQARRAEQVLLSYDGVRSERRQGGWTTIGTSGNAENGPALAKLRDNARDCDRNNAYAKKAKRRWSKRVVGWGITPQAQTGSAELDRRIDAYWKKWVKQCCSDRRMNFYAVQQLAVESAFVSGEVLVRLWDRRAGDNLAVPFQLQLLEPDYLDSSKTQALDGGRYIIQGVQFDALGRIEGYWLFSQHPGEVLLTSRKAFESKLVPADLVLHHAQIERPGDVRAVPRVSVTVSKLRDVAEYADAEIVRKKTAACMVGSVETPEVESATAGAVTTDLAGDRIEEFRPGMMLYPPPGGKTSFFAPPDSGDFAAHKKSELREVAAGLDIPYVVLADDLSDVNYSSFRGGAIDERDGVEQYRQNWLIPQLLDPIWEKFCRTLVLMGAIPDQDVPVKWNPPPFDLLDRLEEAKADEKELGLGKVTWPQLVGNQGYDPEEQIQQIEKWKPRLEAAGVNFFPNSGGGQATNDGNTETQTPAA